MKRIFWLMTLVGGLVSLALGQTGAAKGRNPFPPRTETFQVDSHGAKLNALVYVADGAGPHPVVVLLHGFPGNERNLDLAQDMRRAGWDVMYFNYRGAWGSQGDFSFGHSIEDVASAVALIRRPEVAKSLRLDPNRVVLVGHSMGGFMAVEAGAADPRIMAIALISAADMPGRVPQPLTKEAEPAFVKNYAKNLEAEGMAPLAGCTPEGLVRELIDNTSKWRFSANVEQLKSRPVFVITSDDGLAKDGDDYAAGLRRAGNTRVSAVHFATDHAFSDKRLELSAALQKWLKELVPKP